MKEWRELFYVHDTDVGGPGKIGPVIVGPLDSYDAAVELGKETFAKFVVVKQYEFV